MWRDPFAVLDIKEELSSYYQSLQRRRLAKRPYIVFDPTNGGVHYDVYALLDRNDPHFVQYSAGAAHFGYYLTKLISLKAGKGPALCTPQTAGPFRRNFCS